MWLRLGNLVRHKTGGPIMMVASESAYALGGDGRCECVWVEDGVQKRDYFHVRTLEAVYADGSPRAYDTDS